MAAHTKIAAFGCAAVLGAALLAAQIASVRAPFTVLTVVGERGEEVLKRRVGAGSLLWLGFTHSSEHVRVASAFRIDSGEFRAVETRLEGFGPGLPGGSAAPSSGRELISRHSQAHRSLALLVTRSTGHWLALGSHRVDLSRLIPEGHDVYRFSVRLEPATLLGLLPMPSRRQVVLAFDPNRYRDETWNGED